MVLQAIPHLTTEGLKVSTCEVSGGVGDGPKSNSPTAQYCSHIAGMAGIRFPSFFNTDIAPRVMLVWNEWNRNSLENLGPRFGVIRLRYG